MKRASAYKSKIFDETAGSVIFCFRFYHVFGAPVRVKRTLVETISNTRACVAFQLKTATGKRIREMKGGEGRPCTRARV